MLPHSEADLTLNYYNSNAAEYCASTLRVDMSALDEPFLAHIPQHGRILDAGCGSGRDSLAFLRRGHDVLSIDGSAEMVRTTSSLTGRAAVMMQFGEMEFEAEFDGVWACASLPHIPKGLMPTVFRRFERALKPGGVWFMSFKSGNHEGWRNGRYFSEYTEQALTDRDLLWRCCRFGQRRTLGPTAVNNIGRMRW